MRPRERSRRGDLRDGFVTVGLGVSMFANWFSRIGNRCGLGDPFGGGDSGWGLSAFGLGIWDGSGLVGLEMGWMDLDAIEIIIIIITSGRLVRRHVVPAMPSGAQEGTASLVPWQYVSPALVPSLRLTLSLPSCIVSFSSSSHRSELLAGSPAVLAEMCCPQPQCLSPEWRRLWREQQQNVCLLLRPALS